MMCWVAWVLSPPRMLQSVGTLIFIFYKLKVANRIMSDLLFQLPGRLRGTANWRLA